ncbi:hypothetical protein CALVIDRAFT_598408 [Calocera viscosa TUFC12733]|uniref:NB-ARC domain-containing protein n=1 Tax=Calocera viscosa (strain TUFC12733) TaxID=1330018 RepID=A0A167M977_CALVF|nr:hypothetical protein CALVIDRAFT_598408 [Calocera viscosa TUFC12733]
MAAAPNAASTVPLMKRSPTVDSSRTGKSTLRAASLLTIRTLGTFASKAKSSLNEHAGKLGKHAQDGLSDIAGIGRPAQEVKEACKEFRARMEMRTDQVLEKAKSPDTNDAFKTQAKGLQNLVLEINTFLDAKESLGVLKSMTEVDDIKKSLATFDERLKTTVDSLTVNMTMNLLFPEKDVTARLPSPILGPLAAEFDRATCPRICVGRDNVIDPIVKTLLKDSPARIALLGMGGIGKTTIALKVLHDPEVVDHFGNNRVFFSCEGDTTVNGLLKSAAAALRVRKRGDLRTMVKECLSSLKGPGLLVIDNCESVWDTSADEGVEELLVEFATMDNLSLILTIRGAITPPNIQWSPDSTYRIEPLKLEDARQLFTQISGKQGSPTGNDEEKAVEESITKLVKEMGGIPRPITILATLAQSTNPADLLAHYLDDGTVILKKGRGERDSSFDKSTMLSIDSLTMRQSPHALEALRLIALLPEGADRAQLEEMFPTMNRRQEASEAARILLQLALADDCSGYVKVVAPIRMFMQKRYPAAQASHWKELQHYYARLAGSGEHVGRKAGAEPVTRLAKEYPNIVSVLRYSLKTELPQSPILEAIIELARFSTMAHVGDCTQLLSDALNKVADSAELARHRPSLLLAVGRLQTQQGEYDQADVSLCEAKKLFEELHQDLDALDCQLALADNFYAQEAWDDACSLVRSAQSTVFLQTEEDKFGQAQCLHKMGKIMRKQGQLDEARELLEQASDMYDTERYDLGVAECAWELATIPLVGEGDPTLAAMKMLAKAREFYEQIGFANMLEVCDAEIEKVQSGNKDTISSNTAFA